MVMKLLRTAAFAVTATAVASTVCADPPRFRIEVEHPGVYQVSWDELVAVGLDPSTPGSAGVSLSTRGQPVPVWIEDGGDGGFGPGDRLLFVGQRPTGEHTTLDEYNRFKVYWLELDDPAGAVGRTVESPAAPGTTPEVRRLVHEHVERDLIMGRFSQADQEDEDERWYWARISVMDREPFGQVLDLFDLDTASDGRLVVRVGMRGWSQPRLRASDSMSDHLVEVRLDGRVVATGEWNGVDRHVVTAEVPAAGLTPGEHRLELVIPKRTIERTGNMLPDIVLLNWIELSYPAVDRIQRPQARLVVEGDGAAVLRTESGEPLHVYAASGVRYVADTGRVAVPVDDAGGDPVVAVRPGGAMRPFRVVLDRPSDLRDPGHRADYIMISHPSLVEETRRLADFHRGRGLAVEVVDVVDVFDEFNHGMTHPRAIRDFLAHARSTWTAPAPRFVLLAGDASWDLKNPFAEDSHYADWTYRPWETTTFAKNSSFAYAEGAEANDRGLIPTYNYPTFQGHAASDTWFACVEGDDDRPDLAIGRLPAATPDELRAMVDKTIAYVDGTGVGPWRRNMLFIANENPGFQRRMDDAAAAALRRGYVPLKVYPKPDEPVNEHHTERIVELMDRGLQIIEFLGHGGRYIWRTAPSDLKENRDLFTLDHLDRLAEPPLLPVVVSLTCYSAPFDHPSADSIGEKLVRIPGRGAIAVVGASWRNSPSPEMGEVLLEELVSPGATIGEAVMRSKWRLRTPMLIHLYNLLGDPAVPMALPASGLELEARQNTDGGVRIAGRVGSGPFTGEALVEWLGEDGAVLGGSTVAVDGSRFAVDGQMLPAAVRSIRAYAWDPERKRDALGWVAVAPGDDDRVAAAAGPDVPKPAQAPPESAAAGRAEHTDDKETTQ